MRVIYILIVSLFLSCKTQQIDTKTKTKTEIKTEQTSQLTELKSVEISEYWKANDLQSLNLGYDFTLKSVNDKPAKITEFRNGKPYRTIIAQNAEYSENKTKKEQFKSEVVKDYKADFFALKKEFEKQNTIINQLQTKIEQLKIDTLKIVNNIKYFLWAFLLFLIVWIGERTGVFRMIKRLKN